MSATTPTLSVATLFQEREAQRRKDREAEEQLQRRRQEEFAAFRKRLDEFELTNERVEAAISRVKRAFERGESELMITSFPSSFCSDDGRAIANAAALDKTDQKDGVPGWVGTIPKGLRRFTIIGGGTCSQAGSDSLLGLLTTPTESREMWVCS